MKKRLFVLLFLALLALAIVIILKNYRAKLETIIENPNIEEIKILGIPSQIKKQGVQLIPKQKLIKMVAPIANEEWIIGRSHFIQWSSEANAGGEIYLIDGNTKQPVGWIISELGPRQISYNWDTRSVFLNRYSPAKKDINVGQYFIVVKFDNNLPSLRSGLFSIIYPDQEKQVVQQILIKDYKFNPNVINAKKGELIIFVNNDRVNHRILSSGFGPYNLKPGESAFLETKILNTGAYTFYSENYSSMSGMLIVR